MTPRRYRPEPRRPLTLLFAVLLAVCTMLAAGPGAETAHAASATFSISLRPSVVAVVPGGSASTVVRLTRRAGFTSPVSLSYSAPAGVSLRLASSRAAAETPVTVSASGGLRAGNYSVTIRAAAKGRTVSARLTVAVAAAPPTAAPTAAPTSAPTTTPAATVAPTTAAVTVAPTTTAAEASDFTLSANPAAITVLPGAIATTVITVTRTGGFKDTLELGATGVPPGMTVTFQPNPVDGTAASMVVSASGASQGVFPITVGSRSRSTKVNVTVGGDFQLAATPAALTVAAGGTATSTVGITRSGGFAGPVTLTVGGLPEGVTAVFETPTATGATDVLRVVTAAQVKTGSYTLTVTGTSGSVTRTTPITVLVTPAPLGLGINVSKASVVPGKSAAFTLTLVRPAGDNSVTPATFSISGLPPLSSVAFAPPSSATTTTATVTTGASTPLGTYPLNFAATINGAVVANVAASLSVSPANVSFDLVPAVASATAARGATAIYTIGASWQGPTQPITFTITGLPATVVASYTANPGPTGTTLFLTPAAATAPGSYPFVLTGTAGAFVNNQSLTLVVT